MAAMEAHFLKSLYDTRSLEASLEFEVKQVNSPSPLPSQNKGSIPLAKHCSLRQQLPTCILLLLSKTCFNLVSGHMHGSAHTH